MRRTRLVSSSASRNRPHAVLSGRFAFMTGLRPWRPYPLADHTFGRPKSYFRMMYVRALRNRVSHADHDRSNPIGGCRTKKEVAVKHKILMLVVAAMLMVAAVSPALAGHGWEPTDWWQWSEDSDWWCMGWWYHDENDDWTFESLLCYNTESGEYWSWP